MQFMNEKIVKSICETLEIELFISQSILSGALVCIPGSNDNVMEPIIPGLSLWFHMFACKNLHDHFIESI